MSDDDILRMIDDTIRDTSISPDAMRQRPPSRRAIAVTIDPGNVTGVAIAPTPAQRAGIELTPAQRAAQREMILAMFQEIGTHIHQQLEQFFGVVGQMVGHVHDQLLVAGFVPPPPPANPMLAVIEARRHRNTGPKPPLRAPRSIDPRKNR